MEIENLKCSACDLNKTLDCFNIDRSKARGYNYRCKMCEKNCTIKKKVILLNSKVCYKCKIEKPFSEYNKCKARKSGFNAICRECGSAQKKAHRILLSTKLKEANYAKIYRSTEKGKEHTKKQNKKRRGKNITILSKIRGRAKEKGMEFNITIDDIIIPEFCPVLGIPIIKISPENSFGPRDNSPSMDRIDSTKGYIKGNVCIISNRANRIKSDGTIEEHQKVIEYMKKYKTI